MSKAELERFANDVRTNDTLKAEAKSAGTDEAAVAAFAKSKGYDFSAEELKAYADARKAELSDEELDKVAGGGTTAVQTNVDVQTNVQVQAEVQVESVAQVGAAAEVAAAAVAVVVAT